MVTYTNLAIEHTEKSTALVVGNNLEIMTEFNLMYMLAGLNTNTTDGGLQYKTLERADQRRVRLSQLSHVYILNTKSRELFESSLNDLNGVIDSYSIYTPNIIIPRFGAGGFVEEYWKIILHDVVAKRLTSDVDIQIQNLDTMRVLHQY